MCQIDNFLKIYWNIEYEDKLTIKRATEIIINIRLWSAFLTIIYLFLIAPENSMCQTSPFPICITLKPSYYTWNMFFHAVLYGVCIFVNAYLIKKVLKLQVTVVPVVNLPVQCQIKNPTVNIEHEDQEEQGTSTQNQCEDRERMQIPSVSYSVSQEKVRIIKKKETRTEDIERQNSNPDMFYRVPAMPSSTAPPPLVSNVKIVIKVSLQFSCIVLTLVPMNVVQTYLFFSGEKCEDNIMMVRIVSSLSRGLFFIAYVALVFRKLYKISN